MTVLTEARHAAEFIISEAAGKRSRENGVVITGQVLEAGQVVQLSGTKLTAYVDAGTAIGIVIYAVDATDADVEVAYIARDAEVNKHCISYPDEDTGGSQEDATFASLALLGIIAR